MTFNCALACILEKCMLICLIALIQVAPATATCRLPMTYHKMACCLMYQNFQHKYFPNELKQLWQTSKSSPALLTGTTIKALRLFAASAIKDKPSTKQRESASRVKGAKTQQTAQPAASGGAKREQGPITPALKSETSKSKAQQHSVKGPTAPQTAGGLHHAAVLSKLVQEELDFALPPKSIAALGAPALAKHMQLPEATLRQQLQQLKALAGQNLPQFQKIARHSPGIFLQPASQLAEVIKFIAEISCLQPEGNDKDMALIWKLLMQDDHVCQVPVSVLRERYQSFVALLGVYDLQAVADLFSKHGALVALLGRPQTLAGKLALVEEAAAAYKPWHMQYIKSGGPLFKLFFIKRSIEVLSRPFFLLEHCKHQLFTLTEVQHMSKASWDAATGDKFNAWWIANRTKYEDKVYNFDIPALQRQNHLDMLPGSHRTCTPSDLSSSI